MWKYVGSSVSSSATSSICWTSSLALVYSGDLIFAWVQSLIAPLRPCSSSDRILALSGKPLDVRCVMHCSRIVVKNVHYMFSFVKSWSDTVEASADKNLKTKYKISVRVNIVKDSVRGLRLWITQIHETKTMLYSSTVFSIPRRSVSVTPKRRFWYPVILFFIPRELFLIPRKLFPKSRKCFR